MTLTPSISPRSQAGGSGPQRGPSPLDPQAENQQCRHRVSLRRIAQLFKPHRLTITIVVVLITISSIVNLAQPFLLRGVLDDALPQQDIPMLAWLTAAMVLVAAITALIGVMQTWMCKIGRANV